MSSAATGTTHPDLERRQRNAGGPIEDDETARNKMRDAKVYERGVRGTYEEYVGFDPDNVEDVKSDNHIDNNAQNTRVTPMAYFAEKGDLPMMRWLYVHGADTRGEESMWNFPMRMAACKGQLVVCKWLFAHGAAGDVKRLQEGRSALTRNFANACTIHSHVRRNPKMPLKLALRYRGIISSKRDMIRWLVLNGALCTDDDSGALCFVTVDRDLGQMSGHRSDVASLERASLLEWANDLHRARTSFLLFLSGALLPSEDASSTRRTVSHVQLLGVEPGIRKLIGDFDGFVRGREARIIDKLTKMLRPYPFWFFD